MLDTGSTIRATIMNKNLITNVREAEDKLVMVTNAGSKVLDKQGYIPGVGMGYYDPEQRANVLSFQRLQELYPITYDHPNDKFILHTRYRDIEFKRGPSDLYTFKPDEGCCDLNVWQGTSIGFQGVELMETPEKTMEGYSKRAINDAKRARELYHTLGRPSAEKFKSIVRQRFILNCPVTNKDIEVADDIYGPDVSTMKGKRTRQPTVRVRFDIVDIPQQIIDRNQAMTLAIDIFFVNNIIFLGTIDTSIR